MKRSILLLFTSMAYFTGYAVPWGCDWWIKTNGQWNTSQTSFYQKCSDRTWRYPDGSTIPNENIICCDFDEFGNYEGTGINCSLPKGTPQLPPNSPAPGQDPPPVEMIKKRSNLHGNWSLDLHTKVAVDAHMVVGVYHNTLKKSFALLNLEKIYGSIPINISTIREGADMIKVIVTRLEPNKSPLDTIGSDYYVFNVTELKESLYKENISEIVSIFPNPATTADAVKITSTLPAQKVEIFIYSRDGAIVFTSILKSEATLFDPKELPKNMYFYSVVIDGIKVKGGLLEIR